MHSIKEKSKPEGADATVLVKAHKFDVTTAYTLATEAVSRLPSNVVIDSFTLKAINPKTYILTVEGNGYVR